MTLNIVLLAFIMVVFLAYTLLVKENNELKQKVKELENQIKKFF